MLFQNLLIFYHSLLYAWVCIARPNPGTSSSSHLSNLLALNLTLPSPLRISPTALSIPSVGITCYNSGDRTTVAGCRPVLNYFKDFPHYKTIQPFQEDRSPVLAGGRKPPLLIYARDVNCAIEVASKNPLIVDAFSFQEVRAKATEIVEDCQSAGGHGGWSPIGRGIGWHIRVIGVDHGNLGGRVNGTVVVEGVRRGNGTSSNGLFLDES